MEYVVVNCLAGALGLRTRSKYRSIGHAKTKLPIGDAAAQNGDDGRGAHQPTLQHTPHFRGVCGCFTPHSQTLVGYG